MFSRRLKTRQHLFAVLADSSLEPTRYEIRRIVDHVLALEPKPGQIMYRGGGGGPGGGNGAQSGGKEAQRAAAEAAEEAARAAVKNGTVAAGSALAAVAAARAMMGDGGVVAEKSITEDEFVFLTKMWLRLRGHRADKEKEEVKTKNQQVKVSGGWKAFRSPRSGTERFVWRRNADASKLKRQKAKGGAKEGAAEEVMNKIRKMANKRKGMDLKAAFVKFDVNNDGTIEPQELDQVLRSFGIELEPFELDAVFSRFDPDGGGAIDYSEFSYTFYNRRAIAKAAQSGGKIKMPGATGGAKQKSIDEPRGMGVSQSAPSLRRGGRSGDGGGGSDGDSDAGMLGKSGTLMPTVKLATSSEMLVSKIVRALTQKGEPLKTMDSARKEELADRAIRKIAQASMKQKRFDLKSAFKKFDLDGSGTVDKVEFVQIMRGFDPDVSEVEALAAFDRFDPSGDGEIDFQEFSYTFYNRRTFSESTKKRKRRRALGVTQRRQAAEKKNELLQRIERFFSKPECRRVFEEFADKQSHTLDLAGLNASLSQLPLDLNRAEVALMLNTLNEGLHHAVTFDEFKNIIKIRRRNMSACRQSIDENKGAHRKLPVCTTFKAPVLCEDEGAANVAAAAAARVQTMRRSQRLKAKAKLEASKKFGITEEELDVPLQEPTASARRSAMEEAEDMAETDAEAAEDARANERKLQTSMMMAGSESVGALEETGGTQGNSMTMAESMPDLDVANGLTMRPTESTAPNAVNLPPLNLPKAAGTV